MKTLNRVSQAVLAVCVLWNSGQAFAATEQQVLRCNDTKFEQGAYGKYFGMTYHGTDQVCAGDSLGSGTIGINDDGTIRVLLNAANHNPFVMYEVYWIPVGNDPVLERVMVGNILTDCNGDANNTLRDISAPADQYTAAEVDISVRVGNKDAGNFYFYSRGPYGFNDDGTCKPLNYNTSDNTEYGTVANPVLWGGTSNPFFDGVQFISGYELTGTGGTGGGGETGTGIVDEPFPHDPNHPIPGEPVPGEVEGCPVPPSDMPVGEEPVEPPIENPEGEPADCPVPVPAP